MTIFVTKRKTIAYKKIQEPLTDNIKTKRIMARLGRGLVSAEKSLLR